MVEIAEAMRESVEAKRVVDKALEAQDALRQQNEEIKKKVDDTYVMLQNQVANLRRLERETTNKLPHDFQPSSKAIEVEPFQPYFLVPKIEDFHGSKDQRRRLTNFQAQILISRGSNALCCKMSLGTLLEASLMWFASFSYQSIINFHDFSKKFMCYFVANKSRLTILADLFDI